MRPPVRYQDLLDDIREDTLDLIDDTPSEDLLVVPANRERTGVFMTSDSQEVLEVVSADEELVLEPTTLSGVASTGTELPPSETPSPNRCRLIGILLCRPGHRLTGKEIVPYLAHFHSRANGRMNLYLPGFGAEWGKIEYPDREPMIKLEGEQWYFSARAFAEFCEELETHSHWRYSGEVELLIVDGICRAVTGERRLDFSETLQFNLESMIQNADIPSVHEFVEQISRFCVEFGSGENPAITEELAARTIRGSILAYIMTLVPGAFKPVTRVIPFSVRNLEPEP